jgi:rSAM/selenodomain-associated transferase 2
VKLSIVIPALDESACIEATLRSLQPLRAAGHEVVVADGGSADRTAALAAPLADKVVNAPRGRALQMNAGAAIASGEALLFLHADTTLPDGAAGLVGKSLQQSIWGRFDVRIEGRSSLLAVVGFFMNWRSRLTGIATGDQAIFVRRVAFEGFPEIALMEDVAFSQAMKKRGAPACLSARVTTSGRRWEREGVVRTIVLMWRLRLAYALGARPEDLARRW